MEDFKFTPNPNTHISTFILDHLSPLIIPTDSDTQYRASLLTNLKNTLDFLVQLGWAEHTGDWDLSIKITTTNGTFETTPGYYIMEIQGTDLLIEDSYEMGQHSNGHDSYHLIPIQDIIEIQIIRN